MAVLKDLIVHGPSRFINGAKFNTINAQSIGASEGIFNKLVATTLDAQEATIDNLTATNAQVVGLLDVKGDLHTNSWTNSNISSVGGSFYVAPTVSTTIADNGTPMSIAIGGSAGARTFQVTGGAFVTDAVKTYNGTTTSTVTWSVGSHVMVTGNIRSGTTGVDYPLGTLNGYLASPVTTGGPSALVANGFTIGEVNSPALETIISELGTSNLKSYEIKISMYEIGPKTSIKPVGIMMTSYGVDKSTYIDIYGGVNVKNSSGVTIPNVRIGYLGGLGTLSTVNGETPTGWGIYTDHGYFNGVIVSQSGKIGGFTIGSTDLYNGTLGATNSVWMSTGTSSSASIGGSGSIANWAFTAGKNFGVTKTGALYATSGLIGDNNAYIIIDSNGEGGITLGGDVIFDYRSLSQILEDITDARTSSEMAYDRLYGGYNIVPTYSGNMNERNTTINEATLISKFNPVPSNITFTYNGTSWLLNGNTIDIADYGISTTATLANGNTLNIATSPVDSLIDNTQQISNAATNNERNINLLENKVDKNTANISSNGEALQTLDNTTKQLDTNINRVDEKVDAVAADVSDLKKGIIVLPNEPSVTVYAGQSSVKIESNQIILSGEGNTVTTIDSQALHTSEMYFEQQFPRASNGAGNLVWMARRNGHFSLKRIN